jgi:hypothetical protein
MVKLLETSAGDLPGKGIDKLIEEGRNLARELKSADAIQEVKRAKTLSEKMQEFYYQKGLLFIGLKRINDAGHELHRGDPTASAKYNLSILYRHAGKRKPDAAAAGA